MNFMFTESNYRFLKWVATIFLPALASFWIGFSELWDIPNTTAVVGTITIFDTMLGAMLQLSTHNFNKQLTNVSAVVTEGTQQVDDVIGDVVDGIGSTVVDVVGEKNMPYDADEPPSHRKEN